MRGNKQKVVAAPLPVDDGEANLGTITRALWRNKIRILGPTILIAIAAFIGVNLLTPRYKSEARVLVEGRENIFLRPEVDKAVTERGGVDQEAVTSQVQLVLSRDLAREVIKQLDLAQNPEFNPALSNVSPMTPLRLLGLSRDPLSLTVDERVLAAYTERLSAYAVDKSRVIAVEFQSADPELAARVANAVAERYLALQQLAKQDQARAAGHWLSGELEKLRGRVSEAEAKVESFRSQSNMFVGANNTTLSNQQLTELNTQLSAARAQKADAETRARLIRAQLRTGQPLESGDVLNSELIRRLSEQRVALRAQLAEQSSTLLPQHPRIKELRAQLTNLDQQIIGEGERLVRSLENDAKVAGARVDSMNASLEQLKKQAASTGEQDVQLRALEREAKAQRDLFESYLAKYREASARESIAAAPADARIISRAVVSNLPFFPRKGPIIVIATLVTFCLCSAFVVTAALLNAPGPALRIDTTPINTIPIDTAPVVAARASVEPSAPIERSANARTRLMDRLPTAATLSSVAAAMRRPAAASPEPPRSIIEDVASGILQAGEGGRRIAVIGAAREVGTTLTAIALARTLARSARVVLADLSFESPNLDVISSDPSAPGIVDLVHGRASFSDIITRDSFSRTHVVSAGAVTSEDRATLMASHMLAAALDALAQSYDYLVVDAGAYSDESQPLILRCAPRALLVAGTTPEANAIALRERMLAFGASDVTILTGPPPRLDHAAAAASAAA